MSLCLTITSYHKITPGQCAEKSMNQGSMAIGRSSDNDWVLPDPERLVSSQHCVIQYKDGRYYLTDNSTNGVELVNAGIRMRRGNSELLQDGELIRIGDYEIQARIDFNVQAVDSQPFAGESPNSFEALMGAVVSAPVATPSDRAAVPGRLVDGHPAGPVRLPQPHRRAAADRAGPRALRATRLPPADARGCAGGRSARGVGLGDSRRLGLVRRHARASVALASRRRPPSPSPPPCTDHRAATCGRACAPRGGQPTTRSACKPSCAAQAWTNCAWTKPRPRPRWKASAAATG